MNTNYYLENKINERPLGQYALISMLIIDVDGTMTDGGIYYDENGNELKKFNTRDAAGFFCANVSGINTMVLTGRECAATLKRMEELHVDYVVQDIKNKVKYLEEFINEHGLQYTNIGYIGDDLNDYAAMKKCGFVGCPADSCSEIAEIADYVSSKKGGEGAVRDIIMFLLKERGQWEQAIKHVYRIENL